jgi:hypothetical protein
MLSDICFHQQPTKVCDIARGDTRIIRAKFEFFVKAKFLKTNIHAVNKLRAL